MIKWKLAIFSILLSATVTAAFANASYEYIQLNKQPSPEKLQQRRLSGIDNESINNAAMMQKQFDVISKPTPFYTNANINQFARKLIGHEIVIYLKDETVNPTGSFKDRMPIKLYNRVNADAKNHKNIDLKVIAVSTGNHGRAVAYAANVVNEYMSKNMMQNNSHIYSEITMSADAMPHKKRAITQLGATIRDHYPNKKLIKNYDEAESLVTKETKLNPAHTLLLLHADKDAINGYAVIAKEIVVQAKEAGIDLSKIKPGEAMTLVPLGSGGLLSGVEEISVQYPDVYSVGVTAAPADLTYRSLKAGKMIRTAKPYDGKLVVDGVMATPEEFSLKRIREVAKDVVLVRQEDAVYATALLKKNGVNIEPTSGLPLAALLLGVNPDYKNVHYAFVVLTGQSISADMSQKISTLANQDNKVIFGYFKNRRNEISKVS